MNATKPQSTRPAKNPKAPPAATGARLRDADAAKAAPVEAGDANDVDFEHHDTIPAPTWFDDGSDASS
jgi:hypothetical protein